MRRPARADQAKDKAKDKAKKAKGVGGASSTPVVTIEGEEVRATLPEGATACTTVAELIARMRPGVPDSLGTILPDGVKCLQPTPRGCVLVHQTPPKVHYFRWIPRDSEIPYGPEAEYRNVRLALPFLIVLAVFEWGRGRRLHLSGRNECFFVNHALDEKGLETELGYPALLNCSRFPAGRASPLAWICTEKLRTSSFGAQTSLDRMLRTGLKALLHHLLETGFNLSSEHHELSSWFSESVAAGIDPRIASVEAWEEATEADPLFALEVPWLSTNHTLRAVLDLMVAAGDRSARHITSSADIARVVHSERQQQFSL